MLDNNIQHQFQQVVKESQSESDKTKDSLFQIETSHTFKYAWAQIGKVEEKTLNIMNKLNKICESTGLSDKVVRLVGSILKLLKNFHILKWTGQFDKFVSQIGQLRRLLRINRMGAIIKDYFSFFKKQKRTKRDYFEFFFKLIMLSCDINDTILYCMQLKIFKQRGTAGLRRNVVNFYFIECVLWTCQHIFDYLHKDHKTESEILVRRKNISKYVMDMAVSHNEFSWKQFTISIKNSTVLSLISSIVGLNLVWK